MFHVGLVSFYHREPDEVPRPTEARDRCLGRSSLGSASPGARSRTPGSAEVLPASLRTHKLAHTVACYGCRGEEYAEDFSFTDATDLAIP